ncbi:hypothetical protein [Bacillus sp. 491mf]|nr:hypothetical protein [Bacillus sp. 491mf]
MQEFQEKMSSNENIQGMISTRGNEDEFVHLKEFFEKLKAISPSS